MKSRTVQMVVIWDSSYFDVRPVEASLFPSDIAGQIQDLLPTIRNHMQLDGFTIVPQK